MKLSPSLVLRACVILLVAAVTLGLAANLPVIKSPLLPAAYPVKNAAEAPLRFVVVAPLYDHPFWEQVYQGARAAGERLRVGVEFTGPRHASVAEQVQLLDMATAAQVDGIITPGVSDPQVARAVARAADRGIPVVTVETDLSGGPVRRLAYVGTDNYEGGKLAAYELLLRSGGKAVVGIVRGDLGPVEGDERVRGFRDVLASAPGARIVAVESSDLNRTLAGQKALEILREHPDVTALYATSALDFIGVAQSVTGLGLRPRIILVGWDSTEEPEDALVRSGVHIVLAQDAETMGKKAVETLEAYLRRDVRPAPDVFVPVTVRSGGMSR